MNVLALCPGSGALELALGLSQLSQLQPRPVAYVEGEAFAVAHLVGAMEKARLATAPVWSDLRTFGARPWRNVVDCVTGGYPCQPFSAAGKRLGAADPRHLWPHIRRIVEECEPALCVFENVPGHLSNGGHDVARELQGLGFRVACTLWTAAEVGAPHRRERLFIVAAHPDRIELRHKPRRVGGEDGPAPTVARDDGPQGTVAHAHGARESQPEGHLTHLRRWASNRRGHWAAEPNVGRVANGVAARMDRVRMCGNGVVPQQAAAAIDECLEALAAPSPDEGG